MIYKIRDIVTKMNIFSNDINVCDEVLKYINGYRSNTKINLDISKKKLLGYKEILINYYSLASNSELSELEAKRLENILEKAQSDNILSLLIHEIDEITFNENNILNSQYIKNQKIQSEIALEIIRTISLNYIENKDSIETRRISLYHRLMSLLQSLNLMYSRKMSGKFAIGFSFVFLALAISSGLYINSSHRQALTLKELIKINKSTQYKKYISSHYFAPNNIDFNWKSCINPESNIYSYKFINKHKNDTKIPDRLISSLVNLSWIYNFQNEYSKAKSLYSQDLNKITNKFWQDYSSIDEIKQITKGRKATLVGYTRLTAPSIHSLSDAQPQSKFKSFLISGNPKAPNNTPPHLFNPLSGAEGEAEEVKKLLGSKALSRKDITETEIKSQFLTVDIIHMATHGKFDPEEILKKQTQLEKDTQSQNKQNNLVLNNTLALIGEDDSYLKTKEITEMTVGEKHSLQAELVVLSACETGLESASKQGK